MAQQRFGNRFREALWETHGKKCFHCREELPFIDMKVDHLIPEHYHSGEPEARIAVLAEIGLPKDFDILGHGNLAPSCERCNVQKSGAVLVGSAAAIALTRLEQSLERLQQNINKKRDNRSLESLLLGVKRLVDAGKTTPKEARELLDKYISDETAITETQFIRPGTIMASGRRRLGYTMHAKRAMEARGIVAADIADAMHQGLIEGTATMEFDEDADEYIVTGTDGLKVIFSTVGHYVIVKTAYRD